MDRGAWWAIVYGATKSQTRLRDYTHTPDDCMHIMRNAGLEEAQAGIKIAGRNINNLRYADNTTQWQKVRRN